MSEELAVADADIQRLTKRSDQIEVSAEGAIRIQRLRDMFEIARVIHRGGGGKAAGAKNWEQVFLLMAYGSAAGVDPMTATSGRWLYVTRRDQVQWTAEGASAKAYASGKLRYQKSGVSGIDADPDTWVGWFEAHRKDEPEARRFVFSAHDAKRAGLWQKKTRDGNDTPWILWAKNMLQARAKLNGLRGMVPEELGGLLIRGEAPESTVVEVAPDEPGELVEYVETKAPAGPDPLLALEVGVTEPDPIARTQEDAWEALLARARERTGEDEEAGLTLLRELAAAYDAEGIDAAEKHLREHEVFGDGDQGGLFDDDD